MATRRLGPERLGGAYAWRTMLENKVPLAFGSDAPVEPANPFIGLKSATTRLDASNEPSGGWLPAQRLTLAEALRAYGRGAAYASFAEERFGNLAPGQRADFLILDRDIELASPTDLAATQIVELWMDGKRVSLKDNRP